MLRRRSTARYFQSEIIVVYFVSVSVSPRLQKLPSIQQVPQPRFGEVLSDPGSLRLSTVDHVAWSFVVQDTLGKDSVKEGNVRGIQVSVVDYK